MTHFFNRPALAIAAAACVLPLAPAMANNAMTVYVECKHPKQPELPVFKGTGVVVSEVGHVLTAEHVMPEGYECEGALENNTLARRQLQVDFKDYRLSEKIDGKLLRFIASTGESFEYATYCAAGREHLGKGIVVKGFHGKSKGLPSATLGILSTYIPDHRGILETDANTVGGKSGGPVFLQNTDTIIGIVAGAEFDPSGLPAYYGVLTAEALTEFGVLERSPNCGGEVAVAALAGTAEEAASETGEEALSIVAKPAVEAVPPEVAEAAMNLTWADRKLVQQSLTALGLNTHGVDGVWGAKTRAAISNWQALMGQDPTGFLNVEQRDQLLTSAAPRLAKAPQTASLAPETKKAVDPSGESAAELFVKGMALVEENKERQALPFLDRAIELEPNNADFLAWRGYAYYEVRQYKKALADLDAALRIEPSDGLTLADRGWTNFELGNIDQAYSDFTQAIKLLPGGTDAKEGLDELCKFEKKCGD